MKIKSLRIRLLKTGCTRFVLLIGSKAIKIPRFDYGWAQSLRGLLANMQEVEFSPIDPRACPITFHIPGGWLLVMKRCEPISDEQWQTINNSCPGVWMPIPVERRKRDSFGVLNGQVVAVDYGS